MSLITITEAAKLVDKSTQTLYRHIKSGKLSRDASGMVQTAELIRVYGELKQIENHIKQPGHDVMQQNNIDVINLLQQQIDRLERDLHSLKTEGLERERQAIDREKRLMALLECGTTKQESGLFSRFFK